MKEVRIHLCAPAAISPRTIDWAVSSIQAILPTPPLDYEIAESGCIRQIENPGQWLHEQLLADKLALLCNGREQAVVTLSIHWLPPSCMSTYDTLVEFSVSMPATDPFMVRALPLLQRLGPEVNAFWGNAIPPEAAFRFVQDFFVKTADMNPDALQIHQEPPLDRIGWVNYWSAETCRRIDFDMNGPKRKLFAKALACKGGGAALQLTEEPLDLDRPEHLAALTAAYDAFPAIPRKGYPETYRILLRPSA